MTIPPPPPTEPVDLTAIGSLGRRPDEQARADARAAFTGHPADDDRGPGAG